jgi:hypothetical protein
VSEPHKHDDKYFIIDSVCTFCQKEELDKWKALAGELFSKAGHTSDCSEESQGITDCDCGWLKIKAKARALFEDSKQREAGL